MGPLFARKMMLAAVLLAMHGLVAVTSQEIVYCHLCNYVIDGISDGIDCVHNPEEIGMTVYCPDTYECFAIHTVLAGTTNTTAYNRGCEADNHYPAGCRDSIDQFYHICTEVCDTNMCNGGTP